MKSTFIIVLFLLILPRNVLQGGSGHSLGVIDFALKCVNVANQSRTLQVDNAC
jgi:hypothetical protein